MPRPAPMHRLLPPWLVLSIAALASLASGCAAQRVQGKAADIDYHLLMAEFALRRAHFATAVAEYLHAADLGSSPDLAARASRIAHEHGDAADRLTSAKRWVELDPDDIEARSYLLMALVDNGDSRAAIEHVEYLVEQAPEPANGVFRVLALLLERDDPAAATGAARGLVAAHPALAEAHYALASLALRSGDFDVALQAAERATQIQPDWPLARMALARALIASGQEEEGLVVAGDVVRDDGSIPVRLQYALLLVGTGYDEDALIQLERVLEDDQSNEDALRTLAFVHYRLGNLEHARQYFSRLVSSPRYGDDATFYLGAVSEASGDFQAAFALYSRVQREPNVVAAHVRASRMLYKLGKTDESLEYLQRFAEANPEYGVAMLIARANLLVDMERAGEALELYREGLEERPGDEDLLYARAFLYERLDRVDDALAALREILRDRSRDATALNAYGYTLADRTTRYREAERYIRRAIEIEPDNAAIIDSLGWVLYRRGRHEQALEHLRRAWRLGQDPEIAAHLGEVLFVTGRNEEARTLLEEALALNPESTHLQEILQRFGE